MPSNRRGRQKKGQQRRAQAQESQERLIGILENTTDPNERLLRSSARHLIKISRRHRLPVPSEARHLVCRKCHAPHRFGENARVRIKHGQRIITCLECSSVRRFGGGPKSHRRR